MLMAGLYDFQQLEGYVALMGHGNAVNVNRFYPLPSLFNTEQNVVYA